MRPIHDSPFTTGEPPAVQAALPQTLDGSLGAVLERPHEQHSNVNVQDCSQRRCLIARRETGFIRQICRGVKLHAVLPGPD